MMLQCPQLPENHDTAAMAPTDMTILEWQRARLRWLLQQQHQSYFTATPTTLDLHPNPFSILPASTAAIHTCSAFGDDEGSFASGGECGVVEGGDGPVLRTFKCPPVVDNAETKATPSTPAAVAGAAQSSKDGGRESSRKRKAAHRASTQEPEDDDKGMTMKGDGCYTDALMEPKLETPPISSTAATADGKDNYNPTSNKEASGDTSGGEHSKACEPPSQSDYIHVRARRGQATDSHSLAERMRREKISKRMKLLQDLVPGCNKITGKAGVLDEIINYVQSLQRQVEFLSMKLAAVSPAIDSNIDAFFSKEVMQMIPNCGSVVPSLMGMVPPTEPLDASFLIHAANNMQMQQAVAAATAVDCSGLEAAVSPSCSGMDSHEVRALAPTFPWEADLHGLFSVHELQQRVLEIGQPPSAAAAAPIFQ